MKVKARRPGRAWVPAGMAAALVAAVGVWQFALPDAPTATTRTMATNIGEQYRAALSDGSLVELNTASKASVAMAPKRREVRLTSGEALFVVAKDPARPFVVRTEFGDVRAVGTAFKVRVGAGLEVLVSEGQVAIELHGVQRAKASAGERLLVSASGEIVRAARDPEQIKRALAWREGKIAFAGETLAQAAQEFNRYNRLRIEIRDPQVRAMRFGGYFRATDPEGFGNALEHALPVDAERLNDRVVLTMRQDRSAPE
jgi:transmembrane sensor